MRAELIRFGEIEIDGKRYDHDVVIEAGQVRKRRKGPSKAHKGQYGHTPLSTDEEIPWGGKRLFVGTGTYGSLPIMPQVEEEAARRGVELIIVKTDQACRLICESSDDAEINAVLHITC